MPDEDEEIDNRDSLTRFEEFVAELGEDIQPDEDDEDVDAVPR